MVRVKPESAGDGILYFYLMRLYNILQTGLWNVIFVLFS